MSVSNNSNSKAIAGATYQDKANLLLSQGIELLKSSDFNHFVSASCKKEFCRNSSLYRGYYHPSPIYDIVVGNTRRGRIVKQSSGINDWSHQYAYVADGQLNYVETYANGKVAFREYLIYLADKRIGVTIDCYGHLAAISEEQFNQGRLACYSLVNCLLNGHTYSCYNYHEERYFYDEPGLSLCDFINYSPESNYLISEQYAFEHSNGHLSAYTNTTSGIRKTITKRRKA